MLNRDKVLKCSCGNTITFIEGGFYHFTPDHWLGVIEKSYTLTVNDKSIIYNKLACDKCGQFIDEIKEG